MNFAKLLLLLLASQSMIFAAETEESTTSKNSEEDVEKTKEDETKYPNFISYIDSITSLNGLGMKELSHSFYLYNGVGLNKTHSLWFVPGFDITTNFTGSDRFKVDFSNAAFIWSFKSYRNPDKKFRSSWHFISVYDVAKEWISVYYLDYVFSKGFSDTLSLTGTNYFMMDYLNFDQSRVGHNLFMWYKLDKEMSDKWGFYVDMKYTANSPNHKTVVAKNRKFNYRVANSVGVYRQITDKFSVDFNVEKAWYSNGKLAKGGNFFQSLDYSIEIYYVPLFSWPKKPDTDLDEVTEA